MMKMVWISFSLMLVGAMVIFHVFQRNYSETLLNVALQPKVMDFLSRAMEDQRKLSELDPDHTALYRERFDEIQELRKNHHILELNRNELVRNFPVALMSFLAIILLCSGGFYFWQHRRERKRLQALETHLVALSAGQTDIVIPDKRHDLLGHIARMIEKSSGVMAKQRRRLNHLDSLSAWQEAARRHAHEIRTPLTAARMELNALSAYVCKHAPELEERTRYFQESVNEELDRLKDFTQSFTSFAKIGKPKIKRIVMNDMLEKYTELFADAWNNLTLNWHSDPPDLEVDIDKDMVRQVLVNLCNNSSLALAECNGTVTFTVFKKGFSIILEVADDGPGIPESIRPSVFKPYTTSRKIGEGMGLGLAIAKKIMLDHGGDLILHDTNEEGTRFHLIFPENKEDMSSWQ